MDIPDVEAYIFSSDVQSIVSVIESELGSLKFDDSIDEEILFYTCGDTKVIVTKGIDDGFISVWIRGCSAWDSDMKFALFLSQSLNTRVRCDPGDSFPEIPDYANIFAEIYGKNISLVAWG